MGEVKREVRDEMMRGEGKSDGAYDITSQTYTSPQTHTTLLYSPPQYDLTIRYIVPYNVYYVILHYTTSYMAVHIQVSTKQSLILDIAWSQVIAQGPRHAKVVCYALGAVEYQEVTAFRIYVYTPKFMRFDVDDSRVDVRGAHLAPHTALFPPNDQRMSTIAGGLGLTSK